MDITKSLCSNAATTAAAEENAKTMETFLYKDPKQRAEGNFK